MQVLSLQFIVAKKPQHRQNKKKNKYYVPWIS